ncbi:hypothetical protein F2P81_004711 [Scophthalmus maximus]|uniref:Reverse transcriptase domain-containing protein n=1 Tax=Scophthalmus maximus TaxID=52904 RepID=A0A6A4TJI4_SCOMX|nr:hypothetical protein F2P81_004711 [Scophthalmus maximus]
MVKLDRKVEQWSGQSSLGLFLTDVSAPGMTVLARSINLQDEKYSVHYDADELTSLVSAERITQCRRRSEYSSIDHFEVSHQRLRQPADQTDGHFTGKQGRSFSVCSHIPLGRHLPSTTDTALIDRGGSSSSERMIVTGAPQGCVLSPLLYTHDCALTNSTDTIIAFADDTTAVRLISGGDKTAHMDEVQRMSVWYPENNRPLLSFKTK